MSNWLTEILDSIGSWFSRESSQHPPKVITQGVVDSITQECERRGVQRVGDEYAFSFPRDLCTGAETAFLPIPLSLVAFPWVFVFGTLELDRSLAFDDPKVTDFIARTMQDYGLSWPRQL